MGCRKPVTGLARIDDLTQSGVAPIGKRICAQRDRRSICNLSHGGSWLALPSCECYGSTWLNVCRVHRDSLQNTYPFAFDLRLVGDPYLAESGLDGEGGNPGDPRHPVHLLGHVTLSPSRKEGGYVARRYNYADIGSASGNGRHRDVM